MDPVRRRDSRLACALVAAIAVCPPAAARAAAGGWSLEARLGNAWNAPWAPTIRQPGAPTLAPEPRWSTRGLEFPLYYGVRVARREWALDLVHHKLHLENPPPEVGSFAISHGYNLLTAQRLGRRGAWRFGAGAGVVIAHPENQVRGRRLAENRGLLRAGYYVAGPTLAALAGYTLDPWPGLGLGAEARATLSHAEVPIAGGYARVPNAALHASVGVTLGRARH